MPSTSCVCLAPASDGPRLAGTAAPVPHLSSSSEPGGLHMRTEHQHTGGVAPLVSVVLIFLDEERFLEEAVQSVCNQTMTDWELILVDDGSTDRSTRIARELADS